MANAKRPSSSASLSERLAVSCASFGTSARSGWPAAPMTSFPGLRAIFRFNSE